MRALVVRGPNAFEIADVAEPETGPLEVGIRVLAGGICGTDLEILRGEMFYFTSGAASYPVIPCHEWTGIVTDTGEGVTNVSVGDHVVGEVSIGCLACVTCLSGRYHCCPNRTETGILNRQGAFAEKIVLPAIFVHPIARTVSLQSAALVEPAAVAFNGVARAAVSPLDTVAIFGDGPIGLLLLQICRLFGAYRIILVGAADARLALAKTLGADAVIDARLGEVQSALRAANGGVLPNVVFEASGNTQAIKDAIGSTAPSGRLILQGFCGSHRVDDLNTDQIITNDVTVAGTLGSPNIWPEVIRLIEAGKLDPSTIVTDELPISDFGEAIRRIETREAVKVVLRTDTLEAWK